MAPWAAPQPRAKVLKVLKMLKMLNLGEPGEDAHLRSEGDQGGQLRETGGDDLLRRRRGHLRPSR